MHIKIIILLLFVLAFSSNFISASNLRSAERVKTNNDSNHSLFKGSSNSDADSFVAVEVENKRLELEFFQFSENLKVMVFENSSWQTLYEDTFDTCKTLHIVVDLHHWEPGYYTVVMVNDEGIYISGEFLLE